MTDGPKKAASSHWALAGAGKADALATRALSLIATRGGRPKMDARFLAKLEAALSDPDRQARQGIADQMQSAGIPWTEIVDHYIPAIARRLGERWCQDEIGFAEVTIGSARLQAMLREFCLEWSEERLPDPMAPNLLLIVREDDHHTLGAMVTACQLRRLGASVRLALGLPDRAAADMLSLKRFDAVLISASSSVKLESVRNLVKMLRMAAKTATPIVLGGTILETDRDARALTSADHATSGPEEALRLCGVKLPLHGAGLCRIGA